MVICTSKFARGFVLAVLTAMLAVAGGCGGGASAPSGTYVATNPDDASQSVTLDFISDKKVKFMMSVEGMNMDFECDYTWTADTVNVKSPMPGDDDDMVLTRSGNTLTGEMEGDALTFKKQ